MEPGDFLGRVGVLGIHGGPGKDDGCGLKVDGFHGCHCFDKGWEGIKMLVVVEEE